MCMVVDSVQKWNEENNKEIREQIIVLDAISV